MAGLIDKICKLGLENKELAKGHFGAVIGGANIHYDPNALAGIITLIRNLGSTSYLALDSVSEGACNFIQTECKLDKVTRLEVKGEKEERKFLRALPFSYDLISIDCRNMELEPEEIWNYLEGGIEEKEKEFGSGAPKQYGVRKLNPKAAIIIAMNTEASKALYFRLRARYQRIYQSTSAGMVKLV